MQPVIITKALAAAVANSIALSQTPGAAAPLALNGAAVLGGVATLDTQRRVVLTSAGNDSGLTWTVAGSNDAGSPITDTFAGANAGAAVSNLDFRTVTSIVGSGAAAAAVTAGTGAIGSTQWFMPSINITPFALDIETMVVGTVTYSIEVTQDDFSTPQMGMRPGASGVPRIRPTAVVNATTGQSLPLTAPVRGWRMTVTAGTGAVTAEATQAGICNY